MPAPRIGVILANLGTPDATDYWSMRRYLNEFLSDRRVIDYPAWKWQPILQAMVLTRRPFSSGANYRKIWNTERNESPLLTTTRDQAAGVAAALAGRFGDRVIVDFAMRYGNPSTPSVIGRLQAAGCERILFFPLYPQYSAPTTATANDQAFRALMALRWQPALRTVPAYYDHPLYIEALAQSVEARLRRARAAARRARHELPRDAGTLPRRGRSLPLPVPQDDPAPARAAGMVRGRDVVVSFQSRFGPEEWLKPYTVEEVARLAGAGKRHVAVIAPAFSSDCVETLEEINGEIRESFLHAGGEAFTYVPCLNAEPAHIAMMVAIVERELGGWT